MVFGPGWPARGPVEPVVETADPDQKAERDDHHPRDEENLEFPGRVVAEPPPAADHEERRQDEGERGHPRRANPSARRQTAAPLAPRRRRRDCRVLVLSRLERHQLFPAVLTRYSTRLWSWASVSDSPKVPGMTSGWYPGAISLFGSTIDSWMKSASFPASTLSRSGPTSPCVPASASV